MQCSGEHAPVPAFDTIIYHIFFLNLHADIFCISKTVCLNSLLAGQMTRVSSISNV